MFDGEVENWKKEKRKKKNTNFVSVIVFVGEEWNWKRKVKKNKKKKPKQKVQKKLFLIINECSNLRYTCWKEKKNLKRDKKVQII